MKNTLFLFSFLILPFMAFSSNHAQYFSYDKDAVEEVFSELTNLEEKVLHLSQQKEVFCFSSADIAGLSNSFGIASPMFSISDMDWGGFAWGFCCCPVGLFTVVLNDGKSQQAKTSFWIGLGTRFLVNIGLAIINSMLSIVSSASTF